MNQACQPNSKYLISNLTLQIRRSSGWTSARLHKDPSILQGVNQHLQFLKKTLKSPTMKWMTRHLRPRPELRTSTAFGLHHHLWMMMRMNNLHHYPNPGKRLHMPKRIKQKNHVQGLCTCNHERVLQVLFYFWYCLYQFEEHFLKTRQTVNYFTFVCVSKIAVKKQNPQTCLTGEEKTLNI